MLLSAIKRLTPEIRNSVRGQAGVSLIELLITVVFLVVVATVVGLFFPKATQSRMYDRQRVIAAHLASAKMESILKQPYGYIDETPQASFGATPNCNCDFSGSATPPLPPLDMTTMPVTNAFIYGSDSVHQDSVEYKRWVCITQVDKLNGAANWTTGCYIPGVADTGLKTVRVQVRWASGNNVQGVVDLESVASRS